ncbi:DinB family protein [Pelagibacterium lentulum]|uniref:Damage-inducible protein DinB n=1 Tax=Pelagibacterium lentulum TaxID=2029865 RepID=A0A916RI04_9HYPH|nr:DinB family protein [Pelagibacterium lentulum]GGA54468.1 damage-inducible protein DinB [Pelagibacterium lentulum]
MITPEYAQTMAAYNSELNRRIYGAALRLDDAARKKDHGLFWSSIHGTLNHIYWADRLWLSRFGLGDPTGLPIRDSGKVLDDFAELWAQRQAFDVEMENWAAALTQEAIAGDLSWFSGAAGKDMTKSKALCIMQVFNHQTHHRGQVHAVLTALGEKTGDTDLPFVLGSS